MWSELAIADNLRYNVEIAKKNANIFRKSCFLQENALYKKIWLCWKIVWSLNYNPSTLFTRSAPIIWISEDFLFFIGYIGSISTLVLLLTYLYTQFTLPHLGSSWANNKRNRHTRKRDPISSEDRLTDIFSILQTAAIN